MSDIEQTNEQNEGHDEGTILPWIAEILRRKGVTTFSAFLSGSGDSGDIDDIIFRGAGGIQMFGDEVEKGLSAVRLMDGASITRTGWEVFKDQIYQDANEAGNYYDNDGGAVELDYSVGPGGLTLTSSSFTEYEPEEDDEFEEDDPEDPGDAEDLEAEDDVADVEGPDGADIRP